MADAPASVPTPAGGRRPLWARILKWFAVATLSVVGLLILVCTLLVWIFTPARLTPLVEKVASGYIDGELSLDRVELTFWHTFPKLTVEVDSLVIVSHAFKNLPDSLSQTIPAGADTLASVGHFNGGLNLLPLMAGDLSLYDVTLSGVRANVVQLNDSLSNADVFPTEAAEEEVKEAGAIPMITINRFLVDDARFAYRNVADSVDIAAGLETLDLSGGEAPLYHLTLSGDLRLPMLEEYNLNGATFGAQGRVSWDHHRPMALELDDFQLSVKDYRVNLSARVDFTERGMVDALDLRADNLPVEKLLGHLPPAQRELAAPLRTSMTCSAAFALTRPWCVADTLLPSFTASVEIPPCTIEYDRLRFTDVELGLQTDVCGTDMDSTVVTLRRFRARGRSVDVDLSATVANIISDPLIDGKFMGNVNLGALPPKLMERLPAKVRGVLKGDAGFRFRMSDFNRDSFHRIAANGSLTLRDFHAEGEEVGTIYLSDARFTFGSNSRFTTADSQRVDSLLTVSLKVDTLSAQTMGMDLRLSRIEAGGGTLNRHSSSDTTQINPFGLRVAVGRAQLDSPADSLRLRLREASVSGSLRRYKSAARVPQMNLRADAGMLMFGQGLTRLALRKADVDLTVHMRERRRRQVPVTHADSVAYEQRRARWAAMRDSLASAPKMENLQIDMDSTERRLLMRWDFAGSVRAASGRMVTPWFPLRNRVDNVDLTFSQDSVVLRNLACTSGRSDFLVNGTVKNLRRALVSRRNNTLGVDLSLVSDIIDVNEIVRALLVGSSMGHSADSAMVWTDDDGGASDARLEQMADTASTAAILLPHNVDATVSVKAANIIYSDLLLKRFTGDLYVRDAAMLLRNLSASTDIGSVKVEGLYSAPDSANISFGLGLDVRQFRLDRLTELVPAIDSLLPAMKQFAGIVNADVAVTTAISPKMDILIPTLRAALKIEGDSLVLLDADTFKSLSKWLLFKDKKHNVIDHMGVEVVIENSAIELYPFMFDIDRYRLGVMGHNDLSMNLNYHVSVLKSPVPFKFGINIKGTPDDLKIRLGGAKFKENMVGERTAIADNTRINIVSQLESLFRRGMAGAVASGRGEGADSVDIVGAAVPASSLRLNRNLLKNRNDAESAARELISNFDTDGLTPADSLRLRSQGLLPGGPDPVITPGGKENGE